MHDVTYFDESPVVVACADNRYAMPLAVLLHSLRITLSPGPHLTVFVMDTGLSARSRRRLSAEFKSSWATLRFIRVKSSSLADFPVCGHVSAAAYARLLIAELLPETVTKAIYLDCDMVIRGDIRRLWSNNPGDALLMAAQFGTHTLNDFPIVPFREMGLPLNAPYLGSGVLLINVAAWRTQNVLSEFYAYLQLSRGRVQFWDQDVINAVFCGRWTPLDQRWNIYVYCENKCSGQEWAALLADVDTRGGILHFASSIKPWAWGLDHPAVEFYRDYIDRTEWRKTRPRKPGIGMQVRALLHRQWRLRFVYRHRLGLFGRLAAGAAKAGRRLKKHLIAHARAS